MLFLHRIGHRLSQALAHVSSRKQVELPESLAELLNPPALVRFRMLSSADQRHLVDVATQLAHAYADRDVVTAGLLHDIGKAYPGTSIRLPIRAIKVLIEAFHPATLGKLRARIEPPAGLTALWVLARHADLGADFVEEAGYTERVVWLIANHENTRSTDPDLRLLVAADSGRLNFPGARMHPYG